MKILHTAPRRHRMLPAIFATLVAAGLMSNSETHGQQKKAAGVQNEETKSGEALSTNIDSLEEQLNDAAQKEAESLKDADLWTADSEHFTHRNSHTINVLDESETDVELVAYCIDSTGQLLAACSGKNTQEIRVFNSAGTLLKKWPLSISPLQVTSAPGGQIYVAGHNTILILDSDGHQLAAGDCPYLKQAQDEFEKAKEKLQQEITISIEDQVRRFRSRLEEMEAKRRDLLSKPEEELTDADKRKLRLYERSIATFEELIANQQKKSWNDEIAEQLAARLRARSTVCSLSVTANAVFLTAPATTGFGFDIWRGNRELDDWKIIRTGLSGCCGNMDVNAGQNQLLVAENSKFRVLVLDEEGEEIQRFGKSDRDGKAGFSGCCNPMNVCARTTGTSADGVENMSIYTAESGSGLIKRFNAEGHLVAHVGRVNLQSGCKNVSIEVSADGQHVYMLDLPHSKIVVLKPVKEDSGE